LRLDFSHIAGKRHLGVVVVEVLSFETAVCVEALVDLENMDETWCRAGEIDFSHHQSRVVPGELGMITGGFRE
jgi:hypothetical protein